MLLLKNMVMEQQWFIFLKILFINDLQKKKEAVLKTASFFL